MNFLRNVQTVIAIISGVLSIIMFLLSTNEKKKCSEIRKDVEQKIQILNKQSSIKSNDKFNFEKVHTFDNRKSIK